MLNRRVKTACLSTFALGLAVSGTARGLPPSAIGETEGVPVVGWKDAPNWLHHECIVYGQIKAARNIGKICFLNFEEGDARTFTAIIRQEHFAAFPVAPEKAFAGKWVRIHGRVSEYRGAAQIEVSQPGQVEVLAGPVDLKTSATPPAAAAPWSGDTVTLGAYNVLNLYDGYDDPYRSDEGTTVKPRSEVEALARTIRKINADVLALEEVENRGYLERFVRAMLPDMGYEHVVLFEGNDDRGIDCALLSRLPVGPVTSHRYARFPGPDGKPMGFMRDLLEVRIEPPGAAAFTVFVLHLKSKSGGDSSDGLRLAEAAKVRSILDARLKENSDARFVVCGDFNDTWESPPLKTILGTGGGALSGFFDSIPKEKRITYNQEPHRSMIDFLLCSPAMAKGYQKDSYHIEYGSPETGGSDHNPVWAKFSLK